MAFSAKMIGGGVAAAVATGVGYLLLSRGEQAAAFRTISREGAFSVRDYPKLWVAETVIEGMRESAVARGLGRLAEYLFGRGGGSRLTIPVLADGDEDGRGWRTRLVMPDRIRPEGLEPEEGVALRALPPRRIAAMRFSGDNSDHILGSHEAELRRWMKAQGLRAAGPVEHAFYNSPLTPARLRRSEVLIPLAA
ncbi:MAG: heme-binding protein [Sphingomonas sp.]|uniref:SOUL family heme-binding protein n=1 Tax=Sphingomonas sp. TaxID=28214 RepID=UPI0025DB1A80|nr:heme-binding protein [Sphingomonas sp.]MBX3563763.1 heme-binding protein [Sphingomonas sp.]